MNRLAAALLSALFVCAADRAHGQSFDCRGAALSIERAICGDPTLSEWDARMGQQYQQVLRSKRPTDAQALVEQQRSWIQQRNAICGAVPGNALWSCLLDMTRQRHAALAAITQATMTAPQAPSTTPQPVFPSQPTNVQGQPKNQSAPSPSSPANVQAAPTSQTVPVSSASPTTAGSDGTSLLLVIVFVMAAAVGAIFVVNSITRRERRQRLVAKYGEQVAEMIIARQFWKGMTEEQLVEALGNPVERDYEVLKTKTKETWKYGQTGKNRFNNRIHLENGVVTGWKQ
jgi:uncharacterized protein